MRRRDDRDAEFRLQVAEQGDNLLACVQVQIARRFVRQNDGRLVHEGAGDGDALLLAAGNLRRQMRETMPKSNDIKDFRRRFTRLGWCFARENPRQRHVFQRRHRHDQIERLEDVSHLVAADPRQLLLVQIGQRISVNLHMAFRRAVEAAHHVEERRFAGTGRPQNRQIFTTADIEIDSAQRMDFFRAHRIDFRHAARLHNDIFLSAHSSTLMASTGCFFAAM